jgi:hypothetical protein
MKTIPPLRGLSVGLLALAVTLSASTRSANDGSQATPHVRVFGGRKDAQPGGVSSKFDATLADLSVHAMQVRAGHELTDLHAMNPAIRLRAGSSSAEPLVLVDAVTRGDPEALKAALQNLGLRDASVYSNDVGGWLPASRLMAAAALGELHSIRAAMPRTRSGAVTTQGDFAQGSEQLREASAALTGAGVTVGVLSDSFNCYEVYEQTNSGVPASGANGYASNGFTADYAHDVQTGDLPSNVNVLREAPCTQFGAPTFLPDTDEGRAMLQIVHDVAPGASLAFYTADLSEADFANGIGALAKAGATVEADDVGYPDEPFFQDGMVSQAIDAVEAQGVAYFSAAGNDAENSYETTSPSFTTPAPSGPQSGEMLLGFTGSGQPTVTALPVTLPPLVPGEFVFITLQWDQPYVTGTSGTGADANPGASSQLDLCITGETGGDEVLSYTTGTSTTCTGLNQLEQDPNQIILVGIPANASGNSAATSIHISIGLKAGSPPPGRIKLNVDDDGAGAVISPKYATNSPTIQGHPAAAGAVAVGAAFFFDTPACGSTPARLEAYSSEGGTPILFDTQTGTRLATPITRQKPQVVGPDGGNDTFLGQTLPNYGIAGGALPTSIPECQNNTSFPNFLGTSAATPHVASIAALMLQTNKALTPAQITTALQNSALTMGGSSPNANDGFGFVQAGAALALIPPGPPTLSVPGTSFTAGTSTVLTWSSVNTTGCTAGGGWSGALPTSGTQTVTPSVIGSVTYTLTCANAVGSASSSVMISVVAAPALSGHSGGGGAIDLATLFALIAAWLVRRTRSLRAR